MYQLIRLKGIHIEVTQNFIKVLIPNKEGGSDTYLLERGRERARAHDYGQCYN